MKKTLQLLIAFFTFAFASAQDFEVGDLAYTIDGADVEVYGYSVGAATTDIIVPETVENGGTTYNVIAIGEAAFHQIAVNSVVLPVTVKTIKYRAFRHSGLTSINLENVETIADKDVFSECKLTDVDLSNVTYIGRFAFNANASLPSIEIPAAETIAEGAFRRCVFTEITIPSSVTTIGAIIFNECANLKSIQLEWGFNDQGNVDIVDVSENDIFFNIVDPSLITVYVKEGTSGFYTGTGWDAATIVEGIGDIFTVDDINYRVTSIDSLEVEVAGSALAEVVIPETVIDSNSLVEFTVTAIGNSAFIGDVDTGVDLNIPINRILRSVILPTTVTLLKANAFIRCQTLESINLENIINLVGQDIFFDCPKLTTANLSSAMDLTGNFAFHGFAGNSTLTSVDISSAVTLGRALFSTAQFPTINIPASVDSISTKTFWNCTALTDVTVNWTTAETIPLIDVTDNNATFLGVDIANVNLIVPEGTKALYTAAVGWQDFKIIEDTTLSTADIISGDLDIQVNSNELLVNSSSTFNNASLAVYDITGKQLLSEVLNGASATISISNLVSGIYIVKVAEGNVKIVKRFAR